MYCYLLVRCLLPPAKERDLPAFHLPLRLALRRICATDRGPIIAAARTGSEKGCLCVELSPLQGEA